MNDRRPSRPSSLSSYSSPWEFQFEKLDVYRVALDMCREVVKLGKLRGNSDLRNQLERAAQSVALNIAESTGVTGGKRRHHLEIARGSVQEVGAALQVAEIFSTASTAVGQGLARRVDAMLTAMLRR